MRTKEWIFFRHIAPKILALRQQAGRFFVQSAEKISHPLAHPDLISASLKSRTFLAAVGEDVESVRPAYDYAAVQAQIAQLQGEIRTIKHAVNLFNCTHMVPGFDMTIDQMLVYLPQLTSECRKLSEMRDMLPKERQEVFGKSNPNLIDYLYANYDIEQAQADYAAMTDTLARAQLALDQVNQTETMEIAL